MLALGGFVKGSVVIVWSILAPIGALLSGQLRQAIFWFNAFIFLVILSGILQPYLRPENNLPDEAVSLFFIINIGTVSFITFLVLNYFVKQKNRVIKLIRKNRELEVNQLQQEVLLRQSEKLATLGRLSAGIAHELNNPASAGLRASKELQKTIIKLEDQLISLGQMDLSQEQYDLYRHFKEQIQVRAGSPGKLDALSHSDLENEIETWLENKEIEDAWDLASVLAKLNFKIDELANLTRYFSVEQLRTVLTSLGTLYLTTNLLEEIEQGTGRITEIVKSLKSYSYQDKAPLQFLDIHQGLNDTLVMLRSQLKKGVAVHLDFDRSLPQIKGYSNELSQVWTNILDNAITAMDSKGEISIKTFREDPWLVVQISDNGPGIPEQILPKIFDPFFTTKPPGEGTGLGLNISHNIIVQNHKGQINVSSEPGRTCFEIKLHLNSDVLD